MFRIRRRRSASSSVSMILQHGIVVFVFFVWRETTSRTPSVSLNPVSRMIESRFGSSSASSSTTLFVRSQVVTMEIDNAAAPELEADKVQAMLEACFTGKLYVVQGLIGENAVYACQQDESTGRSPLMAAAAAGNGALCQYLLEAGAPWNAIDRQGQCAGNYATDNQHWGVVNLLVDWGVRAELILGMIERQQRISGADPIDDKSASPPPHSNVQTDRIPVEHQPSTKPDYLRQRLRYTSDGKALLDADKDAVMMEWERPLMGAHAQILMDGQHKRVLNVGFGLGIIDSALQELQPSLHIIIEAHPDVYKRMIADGWDKKPNIRICYGCWQDVVPQLIAEGVVVDGVFYDTYGEHYLDLEDFHGQMVHLLSKPNGVYSFFNGLAPDNIFFHGVACQCVKLQLSQLGLDSEFLPCEIQVKDEEWEGIRRKYWHGRDTYYLPRCTWNHEFLATGKPKVEAVVETIRKNKLGDQAKIGTSTKRQKF